MYCSKCGVKNEEEAKFCKNCGVMLASAQITDVSSRTNQNLNSEYKLRIERKFAVYLLAIGTEVSVDGNIREKLTNGSKIELLLPRRKTSIFLKTPIWGGKDIIQSLEIDPKQSPVIYVGFYHKPALSAILPPLCFTKPTASFELEVREEA